MKNQLQSEEQSQLSPFAAFTKDHCRQNEQQMDYRSPYRQDVDRIVQSKSYARYNDKTQVVYLVQDDHITHRFLHVQLVSQFARGLAKILKLNCDLVEAISLGHDVGHPPFGHEGEDYLSQLSEEFGNGPFAHNWQSCRLLREIEPLNLGLAVYDGFLCHSGGLIHPLLKPVKEKMWKDHFQELTERKADPKKHFFPSTLEGCLVKLCDKVCYIGRDIEDAIYLNIIRREDVPKTLLGQTHEEIVRFVANDLIATSLGKDFIGISKEVFDALDVLRCFNFECIYVHPKIKIESNKIKRSYRLLFRYLLEDLKTEQHRGYLWRHYLHDKSKNYLEHTSEVQMVVDYLAGMTDNFFIRTLKKLLLPSQIEI